MNIIFVLFCEHVLAPRFAAVSTYALAKQFRSLEADYTTLQTRQKLRTYSAENLCCSDVDGLPRTKSQRFKGPFILV